MTAAKHRQFVRNVRAIIRTLNAGEEAYCAPLMERFAQLASQDKIVKARQLLAQYPMPTATLQAAQAQLVALADP